MRDVVDRFGRGGHRRFLCCFRNNLPEPRRPILI
jgi:hypothetical protein